jgi:hypothetical protein
MPRMITAALLIAALALPAASADEPPFALETFRVSSEVPVVKVQEYHLRVPRFAPAVVSDGRYIYIIGGASIGADLLSSVERFDPETGKSIPFATLRTPRFWHSAVLVDRKIYVFGGDRRFDDMETGNAMLQKSVEVIDLTSRKVSFATSMPEGRGAAGCVLVGREVFIIGGAREGAAGRAQTNRVLIYNIDSDSWKTGPTSPTPRSTPAVLINDKFIVTAGGWGGKSALNEVEVLNTETLEWRRLPSLARVRSAHSMVWYNNHLILFGDYDATSEILIYNLKTKESQLMPSHYAAARHSAAVVVGEKIYVIGGKTPTQPALDYVQVFAPPPAGKPSGESGK